MTTKIISAHFRNSGVPALGLSPTIDIYRLDTGPVNSLVVSAGVLSEVGGGWYRYDFTGYNISNSYAFTIDGGLVLSECERYLYGGNESYIEETTSAILDEPILNHTNTGSVADTITKTKADTATILVNEVTITALLNLLLKFEKNRTQINTANATLTVFDDDCTTVLWVWDLRDLNGMPSVQEVCERLPQSC